MIPRSILGASAKVCRLLYCFCTSKSSTAGPFVASRTEELEIQSAINPLTHLLRASFPIVAWYRGAV